MLKTLFVYCPYLIWLVTLFTFVARCRIRFLARILWALALAACFSKFFVYCKLAGDAFNPEWPELIIWLWNWAYSSAFILALLSILTVFFKIPRREWILPVIAASLSAWGVWNGIRPAQVREITLEYDYLPSELEGYRIVQLSDLHISSASRRWRTENLVETALSCKGDLIVLTGDIVDGLPDDRASDVEPLSKLKARDGVYAITGNHEGFFKFPKWRPYYEKWGIRFLSDACVFPHAGLALGGLDDPAVSCHPGRLRIFDAAQKGEFRVLLDHRPKGALENVNAMNVRLQLSGHTHGGVSPGISYLVKMYNGGFVRGLYELDATQGTSRAPHRACLYVSPGSGQWAGFPIRFFNPPEITVLKLVAGVSHLAAGSFPHPKRKTR